MDAKWRACETPQTRWWGSWKKSAENEHNANKGVVQGLVRPGAMRYSGLITCWNLDEELRGARCNSMNSSGFLTSLLPNRNALVFITHCWRKLSGIQASFDVATETVSLSGFFPPMQNAMVLGVPSWLAVGCNSPYSIFSLAMILSGKLSKLAHTPWRPVMFGTGSQIGIRN